MQRIVTLAIIFSMSTLLAFSVQAGLVRAETPEPDDVPATEEPREAKFSMSALDTEKGYVEFDAEPGDRHVINLDIRNSGEAAGVAEVYAADAYTLMNGGYGARTLEEPRSGPTGWLNFTAEEFELEPEEQIVHTVTLDVPEDVEAGEHMTSLVIQNQEPTSLSSSGDSIQLDQVSRHAIAVLIKIEGPREPGLEIGEAEHANAGGDSAVQIQVSNPGNAMVLPSTGELRLEDNSGFEMLRHEVSMDMIYAGHATSFHMSLGELLEPGDYWVWLELIDEEQGVSASAERITFHVPEPPEPEVVEGEDGGLAGLIQPPRMPGDGGSGSWWTLLGIIALVSLLATIIGVLIGRRRSRATAAAVSSDPVLDPDPQPGPAMQPEIDQVTRPQPASKPGGLRPLVPKQ